MVPSRLQSFMQDTDALLNPDWEAAWLHVRSQHPARSTFVLQPTASDAHPCEFSSLAGVKFHGGSVVSLQMDARGPERRACPCSTGRQQS